MWGQSHIVFPISYSTGYALTYTVKSTAVLKHKLAQVREFYRYYLPAYRTCPTLRVM
jgi:hypothetical protein